MRGTPYIGRRYPRVEDRALGSRRRPFRRRSASAGPARGGVFAQSGRARPDPLDRHQRGAGAAGRARGLHACRSAPDSDRRPFAAAISKLRAAAGHFAVHPGGQGGFIRRRGDCAGRGGQALYRRGRAGADRDGHSGTAGRLGLPRRIVGGRAGRARPPQGQSADRFHPGLRRRRCGGGGGPAPLDRAT